MQAVDPGVVLLEVGPEPLRQVVGEVLQAGVVHRGLAFPQVVHEQVTDGPAAQLVAVDQFARRELARGAERPQPPGRLVSEDPQLAQHPVEDLVILGRAGEALGLAVHQFQRVADGDIGQHAALGGDDLGAAPQREARGNGGHVRVGVAQLAKTREPEGVAGAGQVAGQRALAGRACHQAAQRGADKIAADHQDQRSGQLSAQPARLPAALLLPGDRHPPPGTARGVGAAGHPAFLPGLSRLIGQPVQQPAQPADAFVLAVGVGQDEDPAGEPFPRFTAFLPGGRPVRGHRTRGEPRSRRLTPGLGRTRGHPRERDDLGHGAWLPNNTSIVSGR